MKRIFQISLILIIVLLGASCGPGNTNIPNGAVKDTCNIAVLAYREKDTFITDLMNHLDDYVQKKIDEGANINVILVHSKNNQEIQQDQISEFIEQDVDVLCVNIVDRAKAADMIDMAREADTPIVFFNREPVRIDMSRWSKVYYVGSKAEESGRLQGEMVADYWQNSAADLNGDGVMQCVLFYGEPNHQDSILRTEHIFKQLDEAGVLYEILVTYTANWQRDLAKSFMELCLEVYAKDIEMIICNNDDMALGAVDAMLESDHLTESETLPIFGIDATPNAKEAIAQGHLTGTVLNDSEGQAKAIIDFALMICDKEQVEQAPKYVWVPYQSYK